jgi:GNAT superfamily N-acetyltransferase
VTADASPAVPSAALTLWRTLVGDERVLAPWSRDVVRGTRGLCPPGWTGVLALGDRIVVEPGDASPDAIARLLTLDDPSDPDQVASALSPEETLGPGELAYLPDHASPPEVPTLPAGARLTVASAVVLTDLLTELPAEDRAESSLGELEEADVVTIDGRVVAACGWTTWPTGVAHIGIAVAADQRGVGLGHAVGAATIRRAVADGLAPQWRAAWWNPASRALARRLGLVEVGRQFSFRLEAS